MMGHLRLLLLCGLVSALGFAAKGPTEKPPHGISTPCKIIAVHDGDTITVEITRTIHVRLLDCWAPELKAPKGLDSLANLQRLCNAGPDKATLFIPVEKDLSAVFTFGRAMGTVWIGDNQKSINQIQVEGGFATLTKSLVK